jgi:3'-phosphoadenosine 5'-phosphosulfate sulfotransferase (PAPS reductase)/FAD synthetase
MDEPILTDDDARVRQRWEDECRTWASLRVHRAMVAAAEREVDRMLDACPSAHLCWSAGKDSTVLVHLIRKKMGRDVPIMSLFTDIELPDTREYTQRAAEHMGVQVQIIEPQQSFWAWLVEHADRIRADQDVARGHHSIGKLWDEAVAAWELQSGAGGVFWGLRKEESRGRRMNFLRRGATYQLQDGRWRSAPLIHWTGRDVYAYALTHDVPLHPVYSCVRFYAHDPSRVRKCMWLPGEFAATGEVVWLRTYYPSLYERLVAVLPDASRWG